jgi:glycine cleavage system H protein
MDIPGDLKFTKDHEWARKEPKGVRVGITDHAQKELTDIVYVGLPKLGVSVQKGKPLCVVESIKSTNDVFAPVSGSVADINEDLGSHPEHVNKDPYGKGWMVLITPSNPKELDELMTPEKYEEYLASMGGKR